MDTTTRQIEVLKFINDFNIVRQYSPTVREIGTEFDIKSPNGVASHLKALRRKGLVDWSIGQSRTIHLTARGFLHLCDSK